VIAEKLDLPSAMNQSTMGKAKLHGLGMEKVDHSSKDGSMTPTVVERIIVKATD
jgi:hypothetical protein